MTDLLISTPPTTSPTSPCDDLGTGEPALLLVPGWCGDRTMFAPVSGLLARHRRCLVADLRGHGGNVHQADDFDSAQQLDDLVALLDERGVDRVVPVATAHAGWFAIELRRRLGADRVPGIVLLDWMVLGTPPGFSDALAGLQDPGAWDTVRAALFGMWTAGVGTPAVHDYVASMGGYGAQHWGRAGREIAASFAEHGTPVDALAALDVPCPTLHLYAQPADDAFLAAQQEVAVRHDWFRVVRLDARSHFPTFEVPDVIAAEIEDFTCSLT